MHCQDHDRAKQDKQRVRATAECIHNSPLLSAESKKALRKSKIRSLLGRPLKSPNHLNFLSISKCLDSKPLCMHDKRAFFVLDW